jgi:sugar phosphate permease
MAKSIPSTPPDRWRIPMVLAITVFINYLDRNTLSLAIPRIAQDFGWSDRDIGSYGEILLGAFFLSYAFSNMLLSPMAERFGPTRSTIAAIVAFSLVTLLNAPLGGTLGALVLLRLLLGVGEGVHIPMLSAITSHWFPPSERSRANAIWGSGILLATASAPLIVIPLIHAMGWRGAFALLGVSGLALSVPLVSFFVQDHPPKSPDQRGLDNEKGVSKVVEDGGERAQPIDYRRDRRFWLVVMGGSLNAFCAFGILNWLPTYFNRAKGIDFEQLGWPLALIFSAGIAGIALMACLGDKFQSRIQLASIGFLLAALLVYLASKTDILPLLVLFFALAVFCQSAYAAQEYAIVQHLLPADRVGAGTGLYNGLSILFGGVGGSFIPGSIIAATGNFEAGMFSIVIGALMASFTLFCLTRILRY